MKILAITRQFTTQLHTELRLVFLRNILYVTLYVKARKDLFIMLYCTHCPKKVPSIRRNHSFVVNLGLLNLWKFKLGSDEKQHKHVLLYILLSFMNHLIYSQRNDNARLTEELISIEGTFSWDSFHRTFQLDLSTVLISV